MAGQLLAPRTYLRVRLRVPLPVGGVDPVEQEGDRLAEVAQDDLETRELVEHTPMDHAQEHVHDLGTEAESGTGQADAEGAKLGDHGRGGVEIDGDTQLLGFGQDGQ